jgi:hypothetical protein
MTSLDSLLASCFVFLPVFFARRKENRSAELEEHSAPQERGPADGASPRAVPQDEVWSRPADSPPEANFRTAYLQNLRSRRLFLAAHERPPAHQQATIFDWDDTLLCTTALLTHGDSGVDHSTLRRLDELGLALLQKALAYGPTFIVTNAVEGWVQFSAEKYFPRLAEQALAHVTVVSARSEHEQACPGDSEAWKERAFLKVQRALPPAAVISSLISIGDSPAEHRAAQKLAAQFPSTLVKTVKLYEEPSAQQLAREVEIVLEHFDRIALEAKNVSVHLSPVPLGPKPACTE